METKKYIIYFIAFIVLVFTTCTLNDIEVVGSNTPVDDSIENKYHLINFMIIDNDTVLMKNNKIYTDTFSEFYNKLVIVYYN